MWIDTICYVHENLQISKIKIFFFKDEHEQPGGDGKLEPVM